MTQTRPPALGQEKPATTVKIYSDGACKGNPGPGGWGARLEFMDAGGGFHFREIFGGEAHTTNNRMELRAVIEALALLKKTCAVEVFLDSEYVRRGITEWLPGWRARNWRTADKKPVKNQDLWMSLWAAVHERGHSVRWVWVKGHSGHAGNERADALANEGVRSV